MTYLENNQSDEYLSEICRQIDCLAVVTDHGLFRAKQEVLLEAVDERVAVFDGRKIFDVERWNAKINDFFSIGL